MRAWHNLYIINSLNDSLPRIRFGIIGAISELGMQISPPVCNKIEWFTYIQYLPIRFDSGELLIILHNTCIVLFNKHIPWSPCVRKIMKSLKYYFIHNLKIRLKRNNAKHIYLEDLCTTNNTKVVINKNHKETGWFLEHISQPE